MAFETVKQSLQQAAAAIAALRAVTSSEGRSDRVRQRALELRDAERQALQWNQQPSSPAVLHARARGQVQQEIVTAIRAARAALPDVEALQQQLLTARAARRRRALPTPTLTEAERKESLLGAGLTLELRQTAQLLAAQRVRDRFAARPLSARVAALEEAERTGDAVAVAVLEELVCDEFADQPAPSPADIAVAEAVRDPQAASLRARRTLADRVEAVLESRLTDADREDYATLTADVQRLAAERDPLVDLSRAQEHVGPQIDDVPEAALLGR